VIMNINIDRDEVLRYLGYRNQEIDPGTNSLIDEAVSETLLNLSKHYTYRIFDLERKEGRINLLQSRISLTGKGISSHLEGAEKCAVMALTLGVKIDEKLRLYTKTEVTKALIMDACATVAVESLAEKVEEKIRHAANDEGLFLTERFSPGYSDLPITVQPEIIKALDAHRKIGLSATESCLLIPQKSVTAVAGFIQKERGKRIKDCEDCSKYKDCLFRKEGKKCD